MISAELQQTARGPMIMPTYTVLNPKGISTGRGKRAGHLGANLGAGRAGGAEAGGAA